jgi:hypothetical protein
MPENSVSSRSYVLSKYSWSCLDAVSGMGEGEARDKLASTRREVGGREGVVLELAAEHEHHFLPRVRLRGRQSVRRLV